MLDRIASHFRRRRTNAAIVSELLGSIAAAARAPSLYTDLGVADSVWGRFEMLALHVFLFQERAAEGGEAIGAIAQELVDAYFKEIDHTIRELGIGDASVPKRMKRLGRMVYGRWHAYGGAVRGGDGGLTEALARNVYAEGGDATRAPALAAYARGVLDELRATPDEAFLAGRFPVGAPRAVAVA